MRGRFLVSYDIVDDRRRRLVYEALRGFGDHIQYSVFRCDLSLRERIELIAAIHALIGHDEDQVLVVDLGPVDGRGADCVEAIGRPYTNPERHAVII